MRTLAQQIKVIERAKTPQGAYRSMNRWLTNQGIRHMPDTSTETSLADVKNVYLDYLATLDTATEAQAVETSNEIETISELEEILTKL